MFIVIQDTTNLQVVIQTQLSIISAMVGFLEIYINCLYTLGVTPFIFLKARIKLLASEKPERYATSFTGKFFFARNNNDLSILSFLI